MNPISVHRCVADVRMKLTVPASSPSGSSGDGARVLSIIAKANDSGFGNERMPPGGPSVNSSLKSVAESQGPMGMWEYISGCGEDSLKNVSPCFSGMNGTNLTRSFDFSLIENGKMDAEAILVQGRWYSWA